MDETCIFNHTVGREVVAYYLVESAPVQDEQFGHDFGVSERSELIRVKLGRVYQGEAVLGGIL